MPATVSLLRVLLAVALSALAGLASAATSPAPLTRDEVVAALSRDIAGHFNLEGELRLELVREWSPPARVAAAWRISVLEYPAMPSASMLLRCRITGDEAAMGESTLVVRAALWRDAWATRQPLTAGTPFDVSMLEVRRIDFFRERDALPAAVGDHAFIFSRGVTAGRLLTWHDIARRPLVKKGDLVEVSATEGALVVTLKAVAMENGAHGDTVTVRNPESQKNISAVVVDENRVQVRF